VTYQNGGNDIIVTSTLLIDATELGDVGSDSRVCPIDWEWMLERLLEKSMHQLRRINIIQDLTYVATLQDYGNGVDKTIPKPANYDPAEFVCACAHADSYH